MPVLGEVLNALGEMSGELAGAVDAIATELVASLSIGDQVAISHLPDGTTIMTEIFDRTT